MKSIVVPVNFSASSTNAAHYAADLALAIGADLHLIHVFEIPASVSMVPMPESSYEELFQDKVEQLHGLAKDLTARTAGKVDIAVDIDTDSLEERIRELYDGHKPFLVVTGVASDSWLNVLYGNNTVWPLHHISYPILLIPEHAAFKAIKKIVIACDREDIDSGMPDTLPFLRQLSELFGSSLEVVHVLTAGNESASEAISEYNIWRKEIKALAPNLHFIRRPRVDDGINAYLTDHTTDWLIVFPKVHSLLEFHRSRAKQIVKHCPIPVMSIHEQ